ncbi:MAG: PaaI family thioesterase [Sphingosinicella sp.]
MESLPPYAKLLGIEIRRHQAGELLFCMPFGDEVIGRPGFLHGGAIAGLLEFAALGAIRAALGSEEDVSVKPINVTVSYLRGGVDEDTFASATVTRLGSRVAHIEAHAWQSERDKPIAAAEMNVRIRRAGLPSADKSS